MNIKALLIGAALAISGCTAGQATASDDLSDFTCRESRQSTHCKPAWLVKENREAEYRQKILPILKRVGYPREIAVEHPSQMPAIKSGWSVRKNCDDLPLEARTGDNTIDTAKVVYCLIKGKGYKIDKPKFVALY